MNKRKITIIKHCCLIVMAVMLFVSCQCNNISKDNITIYPFPSENDGSEKGLSALYAGLVDDNIVIMGGCNFPEQPASEGGKKRYYKSIYTAPVPTDADTVLQWQKIGEIDDASAYGVSLSMLGGVVCVGGTTEKKSLSTANIIMINKDSMEITINPLPDLPVTLDNMGGAVMDTMLIVAGGNANGKPSNRVFLLDFTNLQQEWVELPSFPGNPRVQPVCAVMTNQEGEKAFYIWGGFSPSINDTPPTVSANGYRYIFKKGEWEELSAPKVGEEEIFLGGAAASIINDTMSVFSGGVNAHIFLKALQREAAIKEAVSKKDTITEKMLRAEAKEYMIQHPEWYKFNPRVLVYNSKRNNWEEIVVTPLTARAGASLLHKEGELYSIGGETKPGIRDAHVVKVLLE
ncbi:MAG: cyclically-permuted mutarotase family protein [Bacteroidaceae bacterium]|nr:cyclically-permuted mutarotase family protein [Bacteroidaceae bacterium]